MAVIWSLLSQLEAAIFGLDVSSIFLRTDENEGDRSIALLVIGGIVFTFIAAGFVCIMIGAESSVGGAAMQKAAISNNQEIHVCSNAGMASLI